MGNLITTSNTLLDVISTLMGALTTMDLTSDVEVFNQLLFIANHHMIMMGCWMIGDYAYSNSNRGASVFY
jgi:hypothetical protein